MKTYMLWKKRSITWKIKESMFSYVRLISLICLTMSVSPANSRLNTSIWPLKYVKHVTVGKSVLLLEI